MVNFGQRLPLCGVLGDPSGTPDRDHPTGDPGATLHDRPLAPQPPRGHACHTGLSIAAFGEPACLSTVAKGGACTAADQQMCYKTCGPVKSGVKLEIPVVDLTDEKVWPVL